MSFINMLFVFERSIHILFFWDKVFWVIFVSKIWMKCVRDGTEYFLLKCHTD